MKINRENDLYFYRLILDNVLLATEDGEIYEISTNKQLNKKYKKNSYRRLSYKNKGIQAHRFIWMFFNGIIPKDIQINHINGKKYDNTISNLELVTNSQNIKHAYSTGLITISNELKQIRSVNQIGSNNVNAKLTDDQVIHIRQQYVNKVFTCEYIQKTYNLSRRAVENILLGRSYKNLPFISKHLSTKNKVSLSKEDIIEIRSLYRSKNYTQKEIGNLFNISRSTVKDIVNYYTHKDIN